SRTASVYRVCSLPLRADSEIQPHDELNDPATVIAGRVDVAVCAGSLTEGRAVGPNRSRPAGDQVQVGMIQRIQRLHPQFHVGPLVDASPLRKTEVELAEPRAVEIDVISVLTRDG